MSANLGKKHARERVHSSIYRLALLILTASPFVVGMSLNGISQQTSATTNPKSEEAVASCSISQTKGKDQLSINCQGMNPEQSDRVSAAFNILPVMNKLLEDKIDPDLVTTKLDELTKSAARAPRVKTYFCDGMWKSGAPNAVGILDTKTGGNDSEFLSMINLLEKKQYPDLLSKCTANIKSTSGWLTPRLFCGLAYAQLDRKVEARAMLTEFEQKAGSTYDVPDCHDMLTVLRHWLSN
jgi:hypothetical protein